jgi:thiol-disulfide isomerase/thioredoxin
MVFEFFSTSCGHCAEAAPMVDEFVRKYTPLGWEFIGVTSDDEAAVREFLADPAHRALYSYSIAVDPDRSAQEVLQNGTLQNLSPRMFVVRDGVLLWCGHPEIAAEPLSAIAAGTWDTAAAKPKFVLDAIVARAKKQAGTRTTEAEKTGDWQPVLDFLDAVAAAIPERASTFELQKFGVLVGPADNPVEGYALGKQLALRDAKDIVTLRTLARTVLNAPEVRLRDLDFAFAVARAADNIGKGEDARANELLALAYFSRGDREKAIAHQTKAIALQTNPKLKRTYETQLSKYRTAEPKPVPHTPKAGGAATKPDPNASGDGADAAH